MKAYNFKTYSYKFLDQITFLRLIFRAIVFFYLIIIILLELSTFRRANKVFVNSYAFGHSVIESGVFFYQYGTRGVCISVGNKKNRNRYLKYFLQKFNLVDFWLPYFNDVNINHALSFRVHKTIVFLLSNSRIIQFILKQKITIIDRETLCNKAAVRHLCENYKVSKKDASSMVDDFNSTYYEYEGNGPLASLHYLEQQKFLVEYNFPSKLLKFSDKFLHKAVKLNEELNGKNPKLCTLILRKSWKAWSGLGIDSYYEAIKFLSEKGYIINVVGDIDEVIQARSDLGLSNVYFYKDYNLNSKIFQLLSVFHSIFCFGDQSGTQTLVHLFGKKNLILNSIPFGQLRYNSIMLPRIWKSNEGKKVEISEYYSRLLYRYHSIKLKEDGQLLPIYYSSHVIFEAVKHFVESLESKNLKFNLQLNSTVKPNSMFLFSEKSSYSPIFFKNI